MVGLVVIISGSLSGSESGGLLGFFTGMVLAIFSWMLASFFLAFFPDFDVQCLVVGCREELALLFFLLWR